MLLDKYIHFSFFIFYLYYSYYQKNIFSVFEF